MLNYKATVQQKHPESERQDDWRHWGVPRTLKKLYEKWISVKIEFKNSVLCVYKYDKFY